MRLAVNGEQVAEQSVTGLEAGKEQEVRFDEVRSKKGAQTLTAIADAKQTVDEEKDDNNERKVTAQCKDED